MHFWIDKRSQQCGFGRSRVASSLSSSGGLGFGHHPRRMHGGSKTTSSSNQISSIHGTSSRQQQQQQHQQHNHHHHHHLHQQQYTSNNPSTSASTSADYSGARNYQLTDNNNFQTCTANSRNTPLQQQQHNQYNNNAQQPSNTNTSAALTPASANNNNHPHQRGSNSQGGVNTNASHHHHHYQHEMRYHHPQFGNMAVRHYQPNNSNANQITANEQQSAANSMPTVHSPTATWNNLNSGNSQSNTSTPHRTNLNIVSSQAVVEQQQTRPQQSHLMPQQVCGTLIHDAYNCRSSSCSASPIQQQQQPTSRLSFNYQTTSSPRTHVGVQCARANTLHTNCTPNLMLSNTSAANNNDNRNGSPAILNESNAYHQHYHHQQQQQQLQQQQQQPHQQQQNAHHQRQLHALIDPADSQLLPSHLKSGVCASLVLASIFVAAAKFYFDHQNSGLEVLIFIAFSVTFLLAACTVSLCHIPKGIIVQRPTSVHGVHGDHASHNNVGASGAGVMNRIEHGGTCQQVLFTRPLAQEHALAAQAGPPPYHIAILLPENGCKDEEESPPPSYDKILI